MVCCISADFLILLKSQSRPHPLPLFLCIPQCPKSLLKCHTNSCTLFHQVPVNRLCWQQSILFLCPPSFVLFRRLIYLTHCYCYVVLNLFITPRLTDLYAFRNKLTCSDRRKLLFLLKGSRFRSKELISYPGALELMLMD